MDKRHLLAAAMLAAIGIASAQPHGKMHPDASRQMHEQMMGSMQKMQSMPMSGDTDRDFAMMMREHHLSGIAMARKELEAGGNPRMKRMARKIIESQQKEVAQFDRWLAQHK